MAPPADQNGIAKKKRSKHNKQNNKTSIWNSTQMNEVTLQAIFKRSQQQHYNTGNQHQQQHTMHKHSHLLFQNADKKIALDLEEQLIHLKLEKLLSTISGHSDFVVSLIRLNPNQDLDLTSSIYLVESNSRQLSIPNATLRIGDNTVARLNANRSDSNPLDRIRSSFVRLRITEVYINHRLKLYQQIIFFYKKLIHLPSKLYRTLLKLNDFWKNLNRLEKYINNTSGLQFLTNRVRITKSNKNQKKSKGTKMVHEVGKHATMSTDNILNSESLEDVPLSVSSDNRAQSIQSLHSAIETPTPESTPSYDELQQRLEEYNRHIEHMNERRTQLQRMHSDAKRHLTLLEQYQRQCAERQLTFDCKSKNGSDANQPPDYDSVEDVQSDMAILAKRMRDMSSIVASQGQLSRDFPGDLGDEIRADQASLEQKMNELRQNGDDIHTMASELDSLNSNLAQEEELKQQQHRQKSDEIQQNEENECEPENGVRVVPIRVEAKEGSTLQTIKQKESEIEAMRTQLRRLKDMMGTIESMETKISTSPITADVNQNTDQSIDRDRTPTPTPKPKPNSVLRNLNMNSTADHKRRLDEISSAVRAEQARISVEKENVHAFKKAVSRENQLVKSIQQEADDKLRSHSITPTPRNRNIHIADSECTDDVSSDSDELKHEYEIKKQEYAEICRRLRELSTENKRSSNTSAEDQNNVVQHSNENLKEASAFSRLPERLPNNDEALTLSVTPTTTNSGTLANVHSNAIAIDASSVLSNGSGLNSVSMPAPMPISGGISLSNGTHGWNFSNPLTMLSNGGMFSSSAPTFNVPPMMTPTPLTFPMCATTPPVTTLPQMGGGPQLLDQAMLQYCINQQQSFGQTLSQIVGMVNEHRRHIENLQTTIMNLQDRVIELLHGPKNYAPNMYTGIRSESVPPSLNATTAAHLLPHLNTQSNMASVFGNSNRAQSEQPSFAQLQQQHHYLHQQQQQQITGNLISNSIGELQHHAAMTSCSNSNNNSIYSTLNNASVNASGSGIRGRTSNAHTPLSHETTGAVPFFMQHHNNDIHQNNANLRRANLQANSSGVGGGCNFSANNETNNTLNNQVLPGNRANNYWDNFRSYSRQNLLSTNMRKSNEGNQQQQQQLQQHQQHQINGEYSVETIESTLGEYVPQSQSTTQAQADIRHYLQQQQQQQKQQQHLLQQQQQQQEQQRRQRQQERFGQQLSNSIERNNKDAHEYMEVLPPRLKNFQQRRYQQPNPLPTGTIITNSLHANLPANDSQSENEDDNDDDEIQTQSESQSQSQFRPRHTRLHETFENNHDHVNDYNDNFVAERYGANYEQSSTFLSPLATLNRCERNINLGNSPRNRAGNKIATKSRQCLAPFNEHFVPIVESRVFRKPLTNTNTTPTTTTIKPATTAQMNDENQNYEINSINFVERRLCVTEEDDDGPSSHVPDARQNMQRSQSRTDAEYFRHGLYISRSVDGLQRIKFDNREIRSESNIEQLISCPQGTFRTFFKDTEKQQEQQRKQQKQNGTIGNKSNFRSKQVLENESSQSLIQRKSTKGTTSMKNPVNRNDDPINMGACSLAAQAHFERENKPKCSSTSNDCKNLKHDQNVHNKNISHLLALNVSNDDSKCENQLLDENHQPEYQLIIEKIIESLRKKFETVFYVDIMMISIITSQAVKKALEKSKYPHVEKCLELFSPVTFHACLYTASTQIPKHPGEFLFWYEQFLETLLKSVPSLEDSNGNSANQVSNVANCEQHQEEEFEIVTDKENVQVKPDSLKPNCISVLKAADESKQMDMNEDKDKKKRQ